VEQTGPNPNQQAFPQQYPQNYGPPPPPPPGPSQLPPPRRKKGGTIKAAAVLVFVIIIAIILIMPSTQDFLKNTFITPFQESYPEYVDITFERTFTVNANGGKLINYTVASMQPQNISQEGVNLQLVGSFSTDPAFSTTISRGSAIALVFNGGPLIGQATKTITMQYQVRETARIWSLTQSDSGTIGQIPASLKTNYLGDEWKILVSDPNITALSKQINGNETNVYAILKSTYDWVTKNIAYPGSPVAGEPKTSVQTLQSRVGDCDDQSNLFLGLVRAAGVPGWLQLGALYNKVSNHMEGHAWVQTYIPYANGGGVVVNIDLVNKNFLVWKPSLICDYTDNGNGNDLRNYYYTFYSVYDPLTYPVGEGPTFSDSFKVLSYTESSNKVTVNQLGARS
jgi:transglutaminase-like putative cysteine protease